MKMYLVRLRHTMDDVPLFIVTDRDEAIRLAKTVAWEPTVEDQRALHLPDMSTPVRIDVVEFVVTRPSQVVYFRDYEDEEPEPLDLEEVTR